ncbi:hypothetical protein GGR50DRAFT_706114 [Xylaria sp. CBS 124048]|nr:hypothetical protein GGR50DRAFT_706114 [Xylaria sp. CBS 124048]
MQANNGQNADGPSGQRSTSLGRFIKKLSNKDTSPAETPEPEDNHVQPPGLNRRYQPPTEADFAQNVASLQRTLKDAWPIRHNNRYKKAHALLVCWADNEAVDAYTLAASRSAVCTPVPASPMTTASRFSSASEAHGMPRMTSYIDMRNSAANSITATSSAAAIAASQNPRQGPFIPAAYQLQAVLERRFEIKSQVWMIPSLQNPQDMLCGKISQFISEHGGPDSLLIFWYGGSAEFVGAIDDPAPVGGECACGEVVWYGMRDELGISARTVTKSLGAARADVLFLNDSPFAQYAYTGHISGPGSFEMLGSGSVVSSNSERGVELAASFTRKLTLMLDSPSLAAHGFSIPELHRKLLDVASPARLNTAAPTAPVITTTTQSGGTGRGRRLTPLIVSGARAAIIPAYPVYCQISQSANLEKRACRNIVLSRLNTPLSAEIAHARGVEAPHVRLTMRLKRPFLDVRKWREWILSAPADAKEMAFKACKRDKDM